MKRIRALVVDDEPLARQRIVELLRGEADVELVGECEDGQKAVRAIQRLAPDLVFLDIKMPLKDGFQVIKEIDSDRSPAVIFVTAYDEYALQAFDVHALDYLLKPFDRQRFRKALQRARTQLERQEKGELGERLLSMVQDAAPGTGRPRRIIVRTGGRVFFVREDEIDWIEASGNYVTLHLGNESPLIRETMGALEARLNPTWFCRIHRSYIVNVDRIWQLQPSIHGEHVVLLRGGVKLPVGRLYRPKLEQRIGSDIS